MNKDTKNITEQIAELKKEITQLEAESSQPETSRDPGKIKSISQKLTSKNEKLLYLEQIHSIQTQLTENTKMLEEEKNQDMRTLIEDDIESLEKQLKSIKQQLTDMEPKFPGADAQSCIMEIRAGTGGEEAALFAGDLFRMYTHYAESQGWQVSVLDSNQSGTGGFKEVITEIIGEGAYANLVFESGVHRVQRVPATEASGRIHTSAASVVVYPMIEAEEDIEIDPSEIKIDVYRSSGPGGQSVNTTDSAVRITHVPTGTVVTCQDEKSQHKNRKKALSLLKSKLNDMQAEEQQEEISDIRKSAIKTGDRSAKIRTYNYPQNRVTDHRIKKSWHNLKSILDGELDDIIETMKSTE